jgi:hypothetical protein
MSIQYNSIEDLKGRIDNSITEITKCYILIKYALNTADENILYEEEFKKRYTNFYLTIHDMDVSLDGTNDLFKQILGIDEYEERMSFLDKKTFDYEEINEEVDMDYDIKASMSSVKMDFYKKNNSEFGTSTRFHIDTDKNSPLDPKAKSEEEKKCIFNTLTNFYKTNLLETNKVLKKDM